MTFQDLGVPEFLTKKLASLNFNTPFPIQSNAIPAILKKQDVLGIAQTGSGKTASYVLPILTNTTSETTVPTRHIKTLVLVPTRELAVQVGDVFNLLGANHPDNIRIKSIYGGVSINPQMKSLMGVDILVATPGRLLELIENNAVFLTSVKTLVLDEADKLLNLGFKEELDQILRLLPKNRQNLLFSATLSPAIENINQLILNQPHVIKIEDKESHTELINQSVYFISEEKKGPLLRYLIRSKEMKQVLVFTSSTRKADNVADKLRKNKIDAHSIHGKKSQGSRTDSLMKFKNGSLPVLVTTDLLSRGIDIEFLPYVINYELPRSPKDYIHRIGRTGRAENPGSAISLVSPSEEHHFKVIQKKMKIWAEIKDLDEIDLQGM